MKNYEYFKGFEAIFVNVMEDAITACRDRGLSFDDIYDFADGIELDMREALLEWIEDETYDFNESDCYAIVAQNSRELLNLTSAAQVLGTKYQFNALNPLTFVSDLFALLINEYVIDFCVSTKVAKATEDAFKFDFPMAYLFEHELEKHYNKNDANVIRIIHNIIKKAEC